MTDHKSVDAVPYGYQKALDRETPAQITEAEEPYVPLPLVEYLRERFPISLPGVNVTLAAVQREAGRQEIVLLLEQIYKRQE